MAKQNKANKSAPGLPTRQEILNFITTSATPAGKREIARAFGLTAQQKITLKALLKDMSDEGLIDVAPGRAFHKMGGVPKVTVLRIVDIDGDTVWATPEHWEAEGIPVPRLRVREKRGSNALGIGDRILARTEEAGKGYIAHPMKKLAKGEEQALGVVKEEGGRLYLHGLEKKERTSVVITDRNGAEPGDLVMAEKSGKQGRLFAKVTQVLGDPFAPRSFSLIAIHRHGIPDVFSEELLAEAARMAKQPLGRIAPVGTIARGDDREDLRHIPIVAIDPVDARDHDDAVWATPDDDPTNPGGWKVIVAIADVSFYVRPGSLLDKEARKRGNSVYFPDRVVPMLPEILSADVCSLKQGVERAAMACHMRVSADGAILDWRFSRAVVKLAANIAYEDAQAAIDGEKPHDLTQSALRPLWDCWAALNKARAKREPLDLDLPERRIVLDEAGRIMSVAPRARLDAHKLIEDYMIAANVAAAKALEAKKAPVMYRVHETPGREKLVALKEYLKTLDVEFALGQVVKPSIFNHIIARVGDAEFAQDVMIQILRTQTQAYYGPQNAGHFGLSLGSYAHFTSPIRRYADLVVHRALTQAFKLGAGGELPDDGEMVKTGELISKLERRAMEAERETVDRYVAAYLADHVGQVVDARITGVQSFGFFATVDGIGGDGLVPARDLGREYFRYDEAGQRLVGEDTGEAFSLGQRLQLRLVEANPISGALRFELPDGVGSGSGPGRSGPGGASRRKGGPPRVIKHRGRPANIKHQGRKR